MKKIVKKKQKTVRRKSTFKPRGISKIVLVAIVAVVLVGAGGVYFFTQKGGGAGSSALPFVKPALNPNCKYNDPELCKFINNFPAQTNYAVSSTGKFDEMTTESIYEIDGTDKFHMASKMNGKENMNTISIGDVTYTLDYSDNKWWKQTFKVDDTKQTSTEELIDKNTFDENTALEDNTTYQFIAKEPCGDLTCFKYEMVSPDSTDTKMYIWFDDKDYLMRKMRMEDKSGIANESVYTYGKVSISEPSPVKEGEPNTFDSSTPDMNNEDVQKMMEQYQKEADTAQSEFDSQPPVEYSAPEEY